MTSNVVKAARTRYSVKAYDATRTIDSDTMTEVKELLRLAPSSVNLQPWHFVIAGSDDAKGKIAKAAEENFPFNVTNIKNASHVVVFASLIKADDEYFTKVLESEEVDGRFAGNPEFKETMHNGRTYFTSMMADQGTEAAWHANQVFLNLGAFLLGVQQLGIDATPMEGVDADMVDEAFGLKDKGYRTQAIVTLGYSDSANDYNANLPKSRLAASEIIAEL